MKLLRLCAFCILSALGSGCGTLARHVFPDNGVYRGVCADCYAIAHGGVPLAVDLPFSAAADTLLLPLDAPTMTRPDPLRKGWSCARPSDDLHLNRETVDDDYQQFIKSLKLPRPQYSLAFYEDGTGRHAVTIFTEKERKWVNYTLIYDRSNVRKKVVKWSKRKFPSMCGISSVISVAGWT